MKTLQPLSVTVQLEPVDGPMLHHIIVVPDNEALQFINGKRSVRILCSVGNKPEFHCALIPRHERFVIIASKQLIKEHKLVTGLPFNISIRPDPNNGLELPEELSEVFAQDEFAFEAYNELTDGAKRGYIYYIRQAKSIETRIRRCLDIAEKIKQRTAGNN